MFLSITATVETWLGKNSIELAIYRDSICKLISWSVTSVRRPKSKPKDTNDRGNEIHCRFSKLIRPSFCFDSITFDTIVERNEERDEIRSRLCNLLKSWRGRHHNSIARTRVETADGNSSFSAPSFLIPSNWAFFAHNGFINLFQCPGYRAPRDLYTLLLRASRKRVRFEIVSRIGGSERARKGNGGRGGETNRSGGLDYECIRWLLVRFSKPVNRGECAN